VSSGALAPALRRGDLADVGRHDRFGHDLGAGFVVRLDIRLLEVMATEGRRRGRLGYVVDR
jgi:hypothetical protein